MYSFKVSINRLQSWHDSELCNIKT